MNLTKNENLNGNNNIPTEHCGTDEQNLEEVENNEIETIDYENLNGNESIYNVSKCWDCSSSKTVLHITKLANF